MDNIMHITIGRFAVAALLVFASGCGFEELPTDAAADIDNTAGQGDGEIGDGGVDDVNTAGADAATPDGESGNCPGGAQCPCTANAECDSALCIETPAGRRCAQKCVENCPKGFVCKPISDSSGDLVSICVARFLRLCDPCDDSTDCKQLGFDDKQVLCADYGEKAGGFCGVTCSDLADCPNGYLCSEIGSRETSGKDSVKAKVCVKAATGGAAGTLGTCPCSQAASDNQKQTSCKTATIVDGKTLQCTGKRTCKDGKLTACTAGSPVAELCNGVDDDCDGETDESACDDSNPCTNDACDPKKATADDPQKGCSFSNAAGSCNADDNKCTEGDTCQGGVCKAGTAKNCDDGNDCTLDSCDKVKGCQTAADDNKPCDDGNKCTKGEKCKAEQCAGGKVVLCTSADACVKATCDQTKGSCAYTNKPDNAGCDDDDKCTDNDTCVKAVCFGKPVSCEDNNPCTTDACDAKVGCTHKPRTGSCQDGNPCTGAEACVGGKCVGKLLDGGVHCNDANKCTKDECSAVKGCVHLPLAGTVCDDGDVCTSNDICNKGVCKGGLSCKLCDKTADCPDDGNPCNGVPFCDLAAKQGPKKQGVCKVNPATVVQCDTSKNDACRRNECDVKSGKCTGLVSVNEAGPCDDGNVCSLADACTKGVCSGPKSKSCDDANACTDDACSPEGGCANVPSSGLCEDGNKCTLGDTCKKGACVKGAKTLTCDDSNKCTDDSCSPGKGCIFAPNTKPCDDGDPCGVDDKCGAKVCQPGKPRVCDDNNPCTDDTCKEGKGCHTVFNTQPCSDGNACTSSDVCKDGKCKAGPAVKCDDGKICTDESCDKAKGCVLAPNKAACNDGNACTTGDHCSDGQCQGGKSKVCDDGNPCTDDSCDAKKGCVKSANSKPCNDNNACTQNDSCQQSKCVGSKISCDDSNPCTMDSCAPKTGCSKVNQPDGKACGTLLACKSGKCVKAGDCDKGVCCNVATKTFKKVTTACASKVVASEFKCVGSTLTRRDAVAGCTGTSATTCDGGAENRHWLGWKNVKVCAKGTHCDASKKGCVVTPKPDLVVVSLAAVPTTPKPGQKVRLDYARRNAGSADAGKFSHRFFLSSDNKLDATDQPVISFTSVGGLAAGKTAGPYSATFTLSATAKPGKLWVIYMLDTGKEVAESDESNNHRSVELTVTAVPNSCKGRCVTGKYIKGAPCQCDTDCAKYKDCCPDYTKLCVTATCGDGTCNGSETCSSCAKDCGCKSGQTCSGGKCVCPSNWCQANNKTSGTWCNGNSTVSCGTNGSCTAVTGTTPCKLGCKNNACVGCSSVCSGKSCGTVNGCTCGNYGGGCPSGYTCSNNTCKLDCSKVCAGKQCGKIGSCVCGNSGGSCPSGTICSNYTCIKHCSSSNCGSGCCKNGTCYSGTSTSSCGSNGNSCVSCSSGRQCINRSCQCKSNVSKKCYAGHVYWYNSCGQRGSRAQTCSSGYSCSGSTCVKKCSSSNCSGCCSNGTCYSGTSTSKCGSNGNTCSYCSGGRQCVNRSCQCKSNVSKKCYGGHMYWYNSCGQRGSRAQTCSCGCSSSGCKSPCSFCGNGKCDSNETPATCSKDCGPKCQNNIKPSPCKYSSCGVGVSGTCSSKTSGWHRVSGSLPLWTFATTCSTPSGSGSYFKSEHARWSFTVKKSGYYSIRTWIPNVTCFGSQSSKYSRGVTYKVNRSSSSTYTTKLNQYSYRGKTAPLWSKVYLYAGTRYLRMYDATNYSDIGKSCCTACGQSRRVFADHAHVCWVGS